MSGNIDRRLKELQQDLNQRQLLNEGYKVFKAVTPVRSGNAQRKTKVQGSDSIHADYAYASRLNQGWSKQAKDGMAQPTMDHIRKYIESKAK